MIYLQGEYHLPGHNFTGPGTQLKYRLERGDQPVNRVDALSLHHDMRYEFYDSGFERFNADVHFIVGAAGIAFGLRSSFRERVEAIAVGGIMTLKVVTEFFNPLKKLSTLGRFAKNAKQFKLLEKVL